MSEYYVYQLVDPRDNKPFYVGKGKGDRILQHEKQAKKGNRSARCVRIREITTAGMRVRNVFVRSFSREKSAYEYEKKLIQEIGLENLTNAGPGGEWNFRADPELRWDKEYFICLLKMIVKTKGFSLIPVMRFCGQQYDLPVSLVDQIKERGFSAIKRRGFGWATREAKKVGVCLVTRDINAI